MAATYPVLHQTIEQHEGAFSPRDFNELSGLVRLANSGTDLVSRQTLVKDLDKYIEPETTGKRLFIARVVFNLIDDAEMAGFATTHTDPESKGQHIDRLFVHPTDRGRRLGKQLVQACVQMAADTNSPYIRYDRMPESEAERGVFIDLNFLPDETKRPRLNL